MRSLITLRQFKLYGNEEHEVQHCDRCLAGAALLEPSHATTMHCSHLSSILSNLQLKGVSHWRVSCCALQHLVLCWL